MQLRMRSAYDRRCKYTTENKNVIVYFKRLDSRLFAIHFTSFSFSFW